MNELIVILAAVAPALVLLWYIFHRDSKKPEPVKLLVKGFVYGVGSCAVAILLGGMLSIFFEDNEGTVLGAVGTAFFGAAIPEECAKLLMLWILVRKLSFFDEYFDGIVYAVAIGMGFAAYENIQYLIIAEEDWLSVGMMRGLISVPGHYAFAVLMGYYYSLAHFEIPSQRRNRMMVLVAPILAHGIFDALIMIMPVLPTLSILILPVFFYFIYRLHKNCRAKINELAARG